jgi:small subunit ribosomal protein S8
MYHVADFVIRIKNASAAHRHEVNMPYSKINKAIAKVLVKEGFLADVKDAEQDGKKVLNVGIRYQRRKPVVGEVEIISKPSLRSYVDKQELQLEQRKNSMTLVVSTSQGIMTSKTALKKGIGGELLFKIR